MVIFHSYVSLPEGTYCHLKPESLWPFSSSHDPMHYGAPGAAGHPAEVSLDVIHIDPIPPIVKYIKSKNICYNI